MPSPLRRGKWDSCSSVFTIALQHTLIFTLPDSTEIVCYAGRRDFWQQQTSQSPMVRLTLMGQKQPPAQMRARSPSRPQLSLSTTLPPGYRAASSGSTPVMVTMTVYDSEGNVVQPSPSNPLNINVYGAPNGVITPTQLTLYIEDNRDF